ncbi:MAG: glycogen debranching enzyme GlgX, partial [Acidobacteriota bacterium]
CQDNDISWYDWNLDEEQQRFLAFVRDMIAIRREQAVFRRRGFLEGSVSGEADTKDIHWLKPDDSEMTAEDWKDPSSGSLGVLLTAEAIDEIDETGRAVSGDTMLLLINGNDRHVEFRLARRGGVRRWERLLDTWFEEPVSEKRRLFRPGGTYLLQARSVALFRGLARGPRSWFTARLG